MSGELGAVVFFLHAFIFSSWFTAVQLEPEANPSIPGLWMNSHVSRMEWREDTISLDAVTIDVAWKNLSTKIDIIPFIHGSSY